MLGVEGPLTGTSPLHGLSPPPIGDSRWRWTRMDEYQSQLWAEEQREGPGPLHLEVVHKGHEERKAFPTQRRKIPAQRDQVLGSIEQTGKSMPWTVSHLFRRSRTRQNEETA
jgi:hypothetical protein